MSQRKPKKVTIANMPRRQAPAVMAVPINTDNIVVIVTMASTVAVAVYGWELQEVKFLDKLLWLDSMDTTFTTRMEEIMEAMRLDADRTRKLLTSSSAVLFEDIVWSTPQADKLETIQQTRTISATEPPADKLMEGQPCKSKTCKGERFRCYTSAPSSGDAGMRSWRVCSACGTIDDP